MKRICCIILCLSVLFSCFYGCKKKNTVTKSNMELSKNEHEQTMTFSKDDDSEILSPDKKATEKFKETISAYKPEYKHRDLYGTDECYDRMFINNSVKKHKYSALDENDELTAEHLMDIILTNNKNYLQNPKSGKLLVKDINNDDFMLSLCQLIVDVTEEIQNKYPDIDFDRFYCNLANLKVFYKTGTLNNAAVSPDMFMELGEYTLQMVNLLSGDNAVRNTVIHEIMHIIQYACLCEQTEHCKRHVGFTYMWDDVELQGNDWAWLFEGSAESQACLMTGDEPITYQNYINYINTLNVASVCKSDIPAYYVQSLSFYNDPYKLFDLFQAETKEEITEVADYMEAIQIIQFLPDEFKAAYKNKYGLDLSDNSNRDDLFYSLKPEIFITLAKTFYKNLADALTENDDVTMNDVFCLIRIFEASTDHHILFSNPGSAEVNRPFIDTYKEIREAFFTMLNNSGYEINENDFFDYEFFTDNNNTINASLSWMGNDKKDFLTERTEFVKSRINNTIE